MARGQSGRVGPLNHDYLSCIKSVASYQVQASFSIRHSLSSILSCVHIGIPHVFCTAHIYRQLSPASPVSVLPYALFPTILFAAPALQCTFQCTLGPALHRAPTQVCILGPPVTTRNCRRRITDQSTLVQLKACARAAHLLCNYE